MLGRHTYTCRTPENALKTVALWTALVLTLLAHIWVDDYFRRVPIIAPLVNGRSFPEAAVDAFLNMTHFWTIAPAAPSLSHWLFLRLETEREGLQYRFLKGNRIIHGRADWKNVVLTQRADGADLVMPGHKLTIPPNLSHYREFLRDVEANCPLRPDLSEADEPFPNDGFLEPEVWRQVQVELHAGRKIYAIKLVCERSHLGLKEAKDYVEQWELGSSQVAETTPAVSPKTVLQRVGSLGCSFALYVACR